MPNRIAARSRNRSTVVPDAVSNRSRCGSSFAVAARSTANQSGRSSMARPKRELTHATLRPSGTPRGHQSRRGPSQRSNGRSSFDGQPKVSAAPFCCAQLESRTNAVAPRCCLASSGCDVEHCAASNNIGRRSSPGFNGSDVDGHSRLAGVSHPEAIRACASSTMRCPWPRRKHSKRDRDTMRPSFRFLHLHRRDFVDLALLVVGRPLTNLFAACIKGA